MATGKSLVINPTNEKERSINQRPLSCRQNSYCKGRSPEISLQELFGCIEGTLNVKTHKMVKFRDIEGTFNNLNLSAISMLLSNLGANENIAGLMVHWYTSGKSYITDRTNN